MNSERTAPSQSSPAVRQTTHPYDALTPDCVLDALDSLGMPSDGRLIALNSYENRVYQIGVEDGAPLVAKFYRPERWSDAAILEEHRFTQALAAQEIPVVPPLTIQGSTLHHFAGFRIAVFARCAGRAPELNEPATLEWMGRFLGRIHAVGALEDYQARPHLDLANYGEPARQWLLDNHWLPKECATAWESASQAALDQVKRAYDRAGDLKLIRLQGDCHAGNVLWQEPVDEAMLRANPTVFAGPHFVDFDDSRMGPAMQDLWMLLSGERHEMVRQLSDVLAGYEDFFDFNPRELHLIEALRTLRLLHYSAWLAQRWQDPAFPPAFPWFNTVQYWQERIQELHEQAERMQEPPLWPI